MDTFGQFNLVEGVEKFICAYA